MSRAESPDEPLPLLERHVWPADPRAPSRARRAMARSFARLGVVDDEFREDLSLAVSEAVSNSVEHAYVRVEAGSERVVELTIRAGSGALSVEIRDQGIWRRPGRPGHRGRGIMLMRRLLESVDITSGARGTTVVLGHSPRTTGAADVEPAAVDGVDHYWPPVFHQAVGMLAVQLKMGVAEAQACLLAQARAVARDVLAVAADLVQRRIEMVAPGVLVEWSPRPGAPQRF